MSKKSINANNNSKEIYRHIELRLRDGVSKAEILEELAADYYDRKTLAHLVVGVLDPELRDKYTFLNRVLMANMAVLVIIQIWAGICYFSYNSLEASTINICLWIFMFMQVMMIYETMRMRGHAYFSGPIFVVCPCMTFADLPYQLALLEIPCMITVWVIAVFIRKKLFPNLGEYGLKKNKDGEYIL